MLFLSLRHCFLGNSAERIQMRYEKFPNDLSKFKVTVALSWDSLLMMFDYNSKLVL